MASTLVPFLLVTDGRGGSRFLELFDQTGRDDASWDGDEADAKDGYNGTDDAAKCRDREESARAGFRECLNCPPESRNGVLEFVGLGGVLDGVH